jgi:hypothetical protein
MLSLTEDIMLKSLCFQEVPADGWSIEEQAPGINELATGTVSNYSHVGYTVLISRISSSVRTCT